MRLFAALACVVLSACSFSAPEEASLDGDVPGDGDTLGNGLIAWYPMDRLVVDTAEDATGRGHFATCAPCPAVVPGRIDSGFRFGASNVRLEVPSTLDLRLTSGFTVTMWLSFDVLPSSEYSCAVNKLLGSTIYNTWQLCYRMSNQSWFFGTQTTTAFHALEQSSTPTAATWYHLAIWWDGNVKQLWLNGSKIDEDQAGSVVFDNASITIGADIDMDTQRHAFPGILDDLRIYNRPLAESEIVRLANP